MILSGLEIKNRIGKDIEIDPYNENQINPNSYNLKLHDELLVYKDKIFDRFYSDRGEKREAHTGLGLSIVRNIIESFGGKISLIKSAHKGVSWSAWGR